MTSDNEPLQIYVRHRAALVDYATPITGCRARAEDVVQDAFLRFMPAPGAATPRRQPVAYLYRIVRNLALDGARRSAMEKRHQTADQAPWLIPAAEPDPAQTASARDELSQVAETLRRLPDAARTALTLYRLHGLTQEAVAARLGVSVPTANRLIRSALLQVAQCVTPDDGA